MSPPRPVPLAFETLLALMAILGCGSERGVRTVSSVHGTASGGGASVPAGDGSASIDAGVLSVAQPASTPGLHPVDVPTQIAEAGGSVRVVGYRYAPGELVGQAWQLEWEDELQIPAPTGGASPLPSIEIDPRDSDYQYVVFFDGSGLPVDGQVHEAGCDGNRPVRGGAELSVPGDYETIQTAIDAARPGDTVRVGPGVFTEFLQLAPNVALVGAGPSETILDAQGATLHENGDSAHLVDATSAYGSAVRGFRFVGVGEGGNCASQQDELECGTRHAAALASDGHSADFLDPCHPTTTFVGGNVFEGNDIGALLYYRSLAIFVDNAFVGNNTAMAFGNGGNQVVQLWHNSFRGPADDHVATEATALFASHNVFQDRLFCRSQALLRGVFSCNAMGGPAGCDLATEGTEGNASLLESPPFSSAVDYGCLGGDPPAEPTFGDFLIAGGVAIAELD